MTKAALTPMSLGLPLAVFAPERRARAVRIWAVSAALAAAAGSALFWARNHHHPVPVAEPGLLRVRSFAWSNAVALAFSTAFAASLLAAVLWLQEVWGDTALRAGLQIAPGPLMVPIFAVFAGLLAKRGLPAGRVAAAGCLTLVAGTLMVAFMVGPTPAYAAQFLPGWLVGGVGVGLALPMICPVPPPTYPRPAWRSAAVVTMSRQLGNVLGVSVLVACLAPPRATATRTMHFRPAGSPRPSLRCSARPPRLGCPHATARTSQRRRPRTYPGMSPTADANWGPQRSRTITWCGPAVTAAGMQGRTGLEFLQAMLAGELPGPRIGAHLDFRAVSVSEGEVVFARTPDDSAHNPIGLVHGGLLCTLLDSVAGCAVHSTLPAGVGYTSIEISVRHLRPVHADGNELPRPDA